MKLRSAATPLLLALAAPVTAQPLIFGAEIEGRAGVTTDPFLRNAGGSSGFVGLSISPVLSHAEPRGSTTLSGHYDTEKYFDRFGRSESVRGGIAHTQQLTEHIVATGQVSYAMTNSPLNQRIYDDDLLLDPLLLDALSSDRKTRQLSGSLGLQWQLNQRDSFNAGVNAVHATFSGGLPSLYSRDYDRYGFNLGYLRSVSARTRLGLRVYGSRTDYEDFPDGSSIGPSIAVQQTLSPIWSLDGDVGVNFNHVDGGRTTKSLGLHLSLCGTYPRTSLCVTAARDSSGGALGSTRTATSLSGRVRHRLDERSSVNLSATYQHSQADSGVAIRSYDLLSVSGGYSRQLTQRLSVGADARYRRRSGGATPTADSTALTAHVRYKIGRLG